MVTSLVCMLVLLASGPGPVQPKATPRPSPTPRNARPPATPRALPTPQRSPAPPGLSWEDADTVQQTVTRIERRLRSGRPASEETVVVSQRQLNSYVTLSLARSIPPSVTGLEFQIQQDRLGARATLDLDRLKEQLPDGALSGVLAYLTGAVPVELVGRFWSTNGTGQVQIEQATVAGVSVPAALIAQIVSLSTRSRTQPAGVDILTPFRLPWTARQIRLQPGRAFVDFYQKQP